MTNPKMTNSLTMFKLETMIYASEVGTRSVFTLNPALQKQLADLAAEHPEVCCQKEKGETGGVTYHFTQSIIELLKINQ